MDKFKLKNIKNRIEVKSEKAWAILDGKCSYWYLHTCQDWNIQVLVAKVS